MPLDFAGRNTRATPLLCKNRLGVSDSGDCRMRLRINVAFFMVFAFMPSASATTCTQAVAKCKQMGASKPNIDSLCEAAGASCMKDGKFIGPVSHTPWKNL